MLNILNDLVKAIEKGRAVAMATLIDVRGASPAPIGFKLLVWPDGICLGNVGAGEPEKRIRNAAQEANKEGRAQTVHYSLKENGEDGLDLGEREPAQIAVANLAEIEMVGHGGIGRPRSEVMKKHKI